MKRVALYLQDAHDLRDGLDCVRYAESRGFEAVWQAESRLVRDAIVRCRLRRVTEHIKVGSALSITGHAISACLPQPSLHWMTWPRSDHLWYRCLVGPVGKTGRY